MRRVGLCAALVAVVAVAPAQLAMAGMDEAKQWIDKEFQPSALTKAEQLKEMEWFINAAKPFKGLEINVLSETIPTHEYEAKTLTKAFFEITGIKVNHQLLGEGEVVQAVQTQMQTNRNLYDAYINDSDLIGTHSRLQSAVNLTDWMNGEGKDVDSADARRQGLHRHLVHDGPRRQDLAAAGSAIREPVLVPLRLVQAP
jgi:glycerol transport system substrate-binding protein